MIKKNKITILQPDDWHVHFREGDLLKAVTPFSSRINGRCIAMPNTEIPITSSEHALKYKEEIIKNANNSSFEVLIPCYLTENLDLNEFKKSLINNFFVGAKLYPNNATTNSSYGVSELEKIFPALEILQNEKKILLIHGEKVRDGVDIFDREKIFIDEDLKKIREEFKELKIVLEHVSTSYGVDFVKTNKNIGGTITPHHMMLTKNDVFLKNNNIDPHHFCMPVVKNETDLLALRNAACIDNDKFFLGTDSAPHIIEHKLPNDKIRPGIFSAVCSIELYAHIFDEENSIETLEKFSSINGPNFYNMPVNSSKIHLEKKEWIVPDMTLYDSVKVKNFFGNKKINWKIVNLNV